jgi:hypothetical protein
MERIEARITTGRNVRRAAVWIATLLLAGSPACKSGDPLSSTIVPATPSLDGETVTATERYVTLRTSSVAGGRIVLDVVVAEVDEPVTAVAIKLTYPSGFSRFVACEDGNLFPPGTCFFSEPAPGSGEVFLGRTVSGVGQATTVTGERVAMRVEFLVFATGSGPIEFVGQNLGGGDTSAVLDVNGDPILMEWFEGSLVGE